MVSLSFTYRERRQFDRLRASLFVGMVLLGKKFLTRGERQGLLLPDRNLRPEFKQFLSQIEAALRDVTDADLRLLKERLNTYEFKEPQFGALRRADETKRRVA